MSQRVSCGMAAESYRESTPGRMGGFPAACRSAHFSWNQATCPISHSSGFTMASCGPSNCSSERSATSSSVRARASRTHPVRSAFEVVCPFTIACCTFAVIPKCVHLANNDCRQRAFRFATTEVSCMIFVRSQANALEVTDSRRVEMLDLVGIELEAFSGREPKREPAAEILSEAEGPHTPKSRKHHG